MHLDWPPTIVRDTKAACGTIADDGPADEVSLEDLYKLACKKMHDAESMSRGFTRQKCYTEARDLFERALGLVETLSIFSENETIDDVATSDLKYLLIRAYLAKVVLSAECGADRLKTFSEAETYLRGFLETMTRHGLRSGSLERAISDVGADLELRPKSTSLEFAAVSRNEKIERYKRMKLLETQLEELARRLESGTNVDDEVVRSYYMSLIKKWTSDSIDSLENEVRPAIYFEKNRATAHSTERAGSPKPSSSSKQTTSPQTLTLVRNNMQKQVFGLGYPSRPTVTVDEFITKKISDGDLAFTAHKEVYSNSLQRYAEQPNLRREQDEMVDIEQEEKEERDDADELKRKRQWDEFKDETPRGSGNRHNMG